MTSPVFLLFLVAAGGLTLTAVAQPAAANYDEAKIPAYTLPDPLTFPDGKPVKDAKAWAKKRRAQVLKLFETNVYGRTPKTAQNARIVFDVHGVDPKALGGLATRKEITIYFNSKREGPKMELLLYVPNASTGPAPAFVGLNFDGNHTISADSGISIFKQWRRTGKEKAPVEIMPASDTRGKSTGRWPVEKIVGAGYALATIYYGDIEPDFADGWKLGVRAWFHGKRQGGKSANDSASTAMSAAKGAPDDAADDDWGAIGAWAWGLSRALDYLERDKAIDAKRVAVIGHSRLGKTALWAGAQDERFAIVISNDSGEGGAALSRRIFGETVERINTSFPHWFCGNYKKYNNHEASLPVDQHMLIALMAPRPVYVASAEEDLWADPRGEFLSAKHADPVYRLLGKPGLGAVEMPSVNKPVGETIRYHIRTGKHDVTEYDWEQYLGFADRHFK